MAVTVGGMLAYYVTGRLEGERWSLFDCLYMTVITISTVGYTETLPSIHQSRVALTVTMVLIFLGSGTLLYFVSNLTAIFVEGDLGGILRRRAMDRAIDELTGHTIVCGAGKTGAYVALEFAAIGEPFVVIDTEQSHVDELGEALGREVLAVLGDATDDAVLERAGIGRARGVIAALADDKSNVYVTISARALSAQARIVAKAVDVGSEAKLKRAGADAVVSPNVIGGLRLVSEMVRPRAVHFLDRMLHHREGEQLRIEEVRIPEGSALEGERLARAGIRELGVLVIAVQEADGTYIYNPGGDLSLQTGASLIVLAAPEAVANLRRKVRE